jgi:phage shock protein E
MASRATNTSFRPTWRGERLDAVIDVRSKLEFWLGHLDGATCISVDVIATELPKRTDLAQDARILVYCASGARSAAAAAELERLGYSNVIDGGGMAGAATKYSAT